MGLSLPNQTADSLQWSGVSFVIIGCLFIIILLIIWSLKIIIPNIVYLGIVGLIIALTGVILASVSTQRAPTMGGGNMISGNDIVIQKESFGQDIPGKIVYKNIGYGPLISKNRVTEWLNGVKSGSTSTLESNWTDANGVGIKIPKDAFRSIYGFIPPSFEFFPYGHNNHTYNTSNYEDGRNKCIDACTKTNCVAVQTEVPQNCFHQTIPVKNPTGKNGTPTESEYVNACEDKATHACNLYYKSVRDADDAYWGLEYNKLGKKFYEYNENPEQSPSGGKKPSESVVKWCDSSVEKPNLGSMYGGKNCTCVNETNCNDPGCCKWRNLLTTEAVNSARPFYNLPIAVESIKKESDGLEENVVIDSVSVKNDGTQECCGKCPGGLISCPSKKCESDSEKNCWKINSKQCSGSLFIEDNYAKDAYEEFKKNYDGKNYTSLMKSCYYRNKATVPVVKQFNCPLNEVVRGCYGSPPIISFDGLEGPYGACSNEKIIPNEKRCGDNDVECLDKFVYNCGTQYGSNRLWVPFFN